MTACAKRAISAPTGTVSRVSALRRDSSLSGMKREKRTCHRSSFLRARRVALRAIASSASLRSTAHREPKQAKLRGLAHGHQDCFVVTADEPPLDSPPLEELPEEDDSPLLEEPPDEDDDDPPPPEDDDDSPPPEAPVEPVELEEPDSPPLELEELDSPLLAVLVVDVLGATDELFAPVPFDLLLDTLAFVPEPRAVELRLTAALSAGS
jgi:hypothetical protein